MKKKQEQQEEGIKEEKKKKIKDLLITLTILSRKHAKDDEINGISILLVFEPRADDVDCE